LLPTQRNWTDIDLEGRNSSQRELGPWVGRLEGPMVHEYKLIIESVVADV
jgi:hypothetical protein